MRIRHNWQTLCIGPTRIQIYSNQCFETITELANPEHSWPPLYIPVPSKSEENSYILIDVICRACTQTTVELHETRHEKDCKRSFLQKPAAFPLHLNQAASGKHCESFILSKYSYLMHLDQAGVLSHKLNEDELSQLVSFPSPWRLLQHGSFLWIQPSHQIPCVICSRYFADGVVVLVQAMKSWVSMGTLI